MRALMFAAVLALAACAQTQTAPPAPGGAAAEASLPQHIREDLAQRAAALAAIGVASAAIGETADLGGGLKLRPLELLEDSRCPQNARCVWAGRVRVRVAVEGGGEVEFNDTDAVTLPGQGAVALAVISPGPWTDWPRDERPPYRFGFKRT